MHLKSLYLRNFRNYKEAEVHFSPHLNVIFGQNAQGKTNLLEAIYFLATGRSFRTQTLSELIKEGEDFFFLNGIVVRDGITQSIKVSFSRESKKLQLDANTYNSFYPLLGHLPSVLYTPYDIELIMGAPLERRRFLNLHLAQSDPLYVHHLSRFHQAMKQRNALLKEKNEGAIDCWEIEMAHSAEYLKNARSEMVQKITQTLQEGSKDLNLSDESHHLLYLPSQGKKYLEQLKKNRLKEMDLGITLIGPHRDDLSLLIDERPAKLFASEGQKKTLIASLKLAELKLLSDQTATPALFGVDDLALHLDETRQKIFQTALKKLTQVFITTAQKWDENDHMIHIQDGKNASENIALID